jgi:thiamine-monophosphate kinase
MATPDGSRVTSGLTAPSAEDYLLDWLRRQSLGQGGDFIGDDAALLPDGRAITVDHQIEGVHFPRGLDPAWVAPRLLAVSLSDLAAVGAVPSYAFLALAAPPESDRRRLLSALLRACRHYDVTLAGGDLATASALHLSLTLVGSRTPRGRWLRRDQARSGDRLWVGGEVGGSAAGRFLLAAGATAGRHTLRLPRGWRAPRDLGDAARLALRRHLSPQPQLELGQWLARRRRAAALDISDGLALDLARLCRASSVGAVIHPETVPRPTHLAALGQRLGHSMDDLMLHGGEDYVLLFTLPARLAPPARFRCRAIGEILAGPELLQERNGHRSPLPCHGWDHLRGTARTDEPHSLD